MDKFHKRNLVYKEFDFNIMLLFFLIKSLSFQFCFNVDQLSGSPGGQLMWHDDVLVFDDMMT